MKDSTSRFEVRPDHPLASELVGRSLLTLTDVAISECESERTAVRSPGLIERSGDLIRVTSRGESATFTASVSIPNAGPRSTGVAARLRLRGWRSLRYLAFGYNVDGTYVHVKFTNLPQDEWFSVALDRTAIDFKLQNGWDGLTYDLISEGRLFIRCDYPCEGASVDIAYVSAWEEDCTQVRSVEIVENGELVDFLDRYLNAKFPAAAEQCDTLMLGNAFPVLPNRTLDWPLDEPVPSAIGENATFRYIWHSLQLFAVLAMRGMRLHNRTMVEFAVREALAWIERSYRKVDPDRKMTWYDHGTAERLISLVVIRVTSIAFLDLRATRSLDEVIDSHARLLRSEAFYAANQATRFHNHSIFQDIALLVVAAASRGPAAPHWAQIGADRLHAQLEALTVHDGEYSTFVENSIGYHDGVTMMVELAEEVEAIATGASPIRSTASAMNRFSELVRSHYGRAPAFGDTYRLENPKSCPTQRARRSLPSGTTVLPEAGYAILRGTDDGDFFQLTMIGSSKSATHKHADHLSLSLIFDGVEWLVDPSFYSHEYDAPVPSYLRGPWAHNMIVVDGVACSITPGTTHLAPHSDPTLHGFTGTTDAFLGSTVCRTVRGHVERLDIVIDDQVAGCNDASYLNLHFGDGVDVQVQGEILSLTHPASRRCLLIKLPSAPNLMRGWQATAKESSIVATEFETMLDSVTARVPLQSGHATWSIRTSAGTAV